MATRSFKIQPPKYSEIVYQYWIEFGHFPILEALKWKSSQQIDGQAKQALAEGIPDPHWLLASKQEDEWPFY